MTAVPRPTKATLARAVLFLSLVLAVAALWTVFHFTLRERDRLPPLQARLATAATRFAALQRERDSLAADLLAAQRQLNELRATIAPAASAAADRDAEVKSWAARVKHLKKLFADRADQRIPELQFLSARDWLALGKTASFATDDDTRKSLAATRTVAKRNFAEQAFKALEKFLATSHGQMPPDPFAVGPYFNPPLDPAVLAQRYQNSSAGQPGGEPLVLNQLLQEKSPIDADYDSRLRLWLNGGASLDTSGTTWIDGLEQRRIHAYENYARANYGAMASDITQLAPYFNPPLDPATLRKLQRAEADYNR